VFSPNLSIRGFSVFVGATDAKVPATLPPARSGHRFRGFFSILATASAPGLSDCP